MLDLPRKSRNPRPDDESAVASDEGEPDRTRQIIGLGVSGAGVVATAVAGIVTYRARSDYKHALSAHCRGDTTMCDAVGLAGTHSARHRANIATAVTVGGLAAAATGAILYFTASGAASHDTEHALYLSPSLDASGGGVVLGGAF